MTLGRLFRFLLMLAKADYWGDVTIHFKAGSVINVVDRRSSNRDNLPKPATPEQAKQLDAEIQRLLQAG